MSLLFPDSPAESPFGGKGGALARLGEGGFTVPAWFAVPPGAGVEAAELTGALEALGGTEFAVRSSAAAEDGSGHSFAGQFDTFLHVSAGEVAAKVKAVRESAAGESVRTYCRERGIGFPGEPTVLVQKMINPRTAGVAFSADPVSGRRAVAVVAAVRGTGEKLVSGDCDGETWQVGNSGILQEPVEAVLAGADALAVAALARKCEAWFGRPQDIEWAIDHDGRLWLLQSRPITTLGQLPDPDDVLRVWDNSNIAESYGGVTTPLTFSFARRIYESVYREFCRLMSVPSARLVRSEDVFPQMLGLIRGRTYYNLGSWYRVLALLPGFHVNRAFMEQMMGVKEPLPGELVERILEETRIGRFADSLALIRTSFGLLRRLLGLGRQVKAFQVRLDSALAPVPVEHLGGEELVAHYRDLERRLLKRWDAPLVNDFFAMIFYGLLRGLCAKWAGDQAGTLQNELLADTGGIISAEPPRRILKMAAMATATPGLAATLANADVPLRDKLAALHSHPELSAEFERYLTDFGDRCLEELKLESPTVRDDASTLLGSIGVLAARTSTSAPVGEMKPAAMPVIGNPLKRFLFGRILDQTRERIRCRENLRFERTRLFGRVRTVLRELGGRLHADGVLASPDDIFYLELGEILSAWEATGTTSGLAALAAGRRTEFHGYRAETAPPDRFETRGPVHRYTTFESSGPPPVVTDGTIAGTGACPGRVTGKVRVVIDPRGARLEPGEILVALQTDPGWVVLFPSAAGLLVERGSLLSHSAIVSRELRLPCIVSLPGITTRLKTGDRVEMDGATGQVTLLDPE